MKLEKIERIADVKSITKKIDTDNLTTKVVISTAKEMMKLFDNISKGIEVHKQYELGKLFNMAVIESRKHPENISVRSIYTALGIPERTFYDYIKNYAVSEELALPNGKKIPSSVVGELRGECTEDNAEHYKFITSILGGNPKREDIRVLNKELKKIAESTGKKVWELTKEEYENYSEPKKEETNTVEPEASFEFDDHDYKEEKKVYARDVYVELFGDIHRTSKDDYSISNIAVSKIGLVSKKEWKEWYKKVAQCLHPDKGGKAEEFAILKDIDDMMKVLIENREKQDRELNWDKNFNEWKQKNGIDDAYMSEEKANELRGQK